MLARIPILSHHEMANVTEEKCQQSGKKYGVICCPCRSTFVASLLKTPLSRFLTSFENDLWAINESLIISRNK